MVVEAFSECVLRNLVDTFTAVTRDPWPRAGPHPVFLFVYPTLHTSHQPREITASLSAAYWQKPFPNQLFRNRRNSPKSQQKAQTVITHATFGFNFLGCALPSIARHSSRHQAAAICLSEYQTPSRWWGRKYREYSAPAPASLAFSICKIATFCISCNLFTTEHAGLPAIGWARNVWLLVKMYLSI